jgi:hypothetical protein
MTQKTLDELKRLQALSIHLASVARAVVAVG